MKSKLFLVVALLTVLSMVLSGCTAAVPSAAPAAPAAGQAAATKAAAPAAAAPAPAEKTLRINGGTGTFPDIIDPQKSSFVGEIANLQMIYEGLTGFNEKLETVPASAKSWKYNDDATQLTFMLRDGLVYSDGSPLNAERFAYSLKRNINPATAGEYAAISDEIAGAPEWRGCGDDAAKCKEAAAKVAESVKATHADGTACTGYDDTACNTLTLTFSKPAPYWHTVAALWVTYPAKEELITKGGDTWWTDPANQIGNGPYILNTLVPSTRTYFVPNPKYWGGVPKTAVDFSYITDTAVAFEAYKNNELDIITLGAEDLDVAQADPKLSKEILRYSGSCTFAVMFHQLKEPFTDQKVREAFAYALDREGWAKDVYRGLATPTLTWIPPGFPGYDPNETRWGFDPAKAKQALAESTYGSADKLPPITLTFSDTPRNRTRFEWLAAKFKEVLGVDAKLDPVESTTYTSLTKDVKTAPQMFYLGWCADYPDPQNWLSVYWKTGAFGERIGYSNPDLDKMMNEADVTLDPAKRMQLYAEAQKKLGDTAPVAFMVNGQNSYLVKPWVSGIKTTPQDSDWPSQYQPLGVDVDTAAQQAASK